MATRSGHTYTPVQVQKLLFLVDQKLATQLGGPFFDFQPYHYGPFDKAVYAELDTLEAEGKVEVIRDADLKLRKYRLRSAGEDAGRSLLQQMPDPVREYVGKLSSFVRNTSFPELVSAIYKAYPEMRSHSIFKG